MTSKRLLAVPRRFFLPEKATTKLVKNNRRFARIHVELTMVRARENAWETDRPIRENSAQTWTEHAGFPELHLLPGKNGIVDFHGTAYQPCDARCRIHVRTEPTFT